MDKKKTWESERENKVYVWMCESTILFFFLSNAAIGTCVCVCIFIHYVYDVATRRDKVLGALRAQLNNTGEKL